MSEDQRAARIGIGALLVAVALVLAAVATGHAQELWDVNNLWVLSIGFLVGIATNRRLW